MKRRGSFWRTVTIFSFLAIIFLTLIPIKGEANREVVYVVPIEDTVEKGLYAYLNRAVTTAEKEGASAIIFEIHTNGGTVDAAADIAKLFASTDLKTISFINTKALSAGAYIALNTDEIYMVPGATMGAAGIITSDGNAADQKAQSYWHSAMEDSAEKNGRNPLYARAMADDDVELPDLGLKKGSYLTLTSTTALEVGYSEGTVHSLDELLAQVGFANADTRSLELSIAEKIARFITNPVVVPILLTIGSLGLVLELYSPGFGIPGFMGISALLLFFYGHLVAGLAGYETLILFVIGLVLIVLEFFLPGGVAGLLGVASILVSLFLAGDNIVMMGYSILIAISISILVSIIMLKVFGKKMKLFRKIILTDSTSTESGYVSNENRTELIGKEGYTVTALRPAGTIVIENERIDVVSEGAFILVDRKVVVVKTEGVKIVVREVPNLNKE